MKLSAKGCHAVSAMLDLAIYGDTEPVSLARISDHQGISLSYLEQLFAKLRREELVVGVRGPGGGYRLARAAERITVAEIVEAVEDRAPRAQPAGQARSLPQELWGEISERVRDFLASITLAEYARRPDVRAAARGETAWARDFTTRSAA